MPRYSTFSASHQLAFVLAACLLTCGCFGVKGPERPSFDPEDSAAKAFETYDTNKDGFIDDKEVEESPGLKAAFKRTDENDDGQLTPDELATRITYYKEAPVAVVSGAVRVTQRGRPLEGAEVTFEPESFLGDAFQTCSATTDYDGLASVSGADAKFPGLYLGFYRVRFSKMVKNKEKLAAKFNDETIIGYEACDDDPSQFADVIAFNLK